MAYENTSYAFEKVQVKHVKSDDIHNIGSFAELIPVKIFIARR